MNSILNFIFKKDSISQLFLSLLIDKKKKKKRISRKICFWFSKTEFGTVGQGQFCYSIMKIWQHYKSWAQLGRGRSRGIVGKWKPIQITLSLPPDMLTNNSVKLHSISCFCSLLFVFTWQQPSFGSWTPTPAITFMRLVMPVNKIESHHLKTGNLLQQVTNRLSTASSNLQLPKNFRTSPKLTRTSNKHYSWTVLVSVEMAHLYQLQ